MIEDIFRSARVAQRLRRSLLGSAFDDLVSYLVKRGHTPATIQLYIQGVEHFDVWLRQTRRPVVGIDEAVVERFLRGHIPRCRCAATPCSRTVHQLRASLRHLLVVLRRTGRVLVPAGVDATPAELVVRAFAAHLRDERGAAPATCAASARYAREFLADQFGHRKLNFAGIRSTAVTAFVAARAGRWTPASMKVASSCLRRFFRYLQMTGQIDGRLALAVPTVAVWRLASLPRVLTDQQVAAVLASFDRSTGVGLRDYATTMCLAQLGLRACEVSALTLDDVDWRAGTITIPATKTRRVDVLPLPYVLARAILAYLRHGRPPATTRQIFVRHATPTGTPGRPTTVAAAVRVAAARAGLTVSASPSAFRHTVATRLLRCGATMKAVADVLRHRSIDTSAIYAKIDLDALRTVTAPWPGRAT